MGSSKTSFIRSNNKYRASRFLLLGESADLDINSSYNLFRSENAGSSIFHETLGIRDGIRHNLRIKAEDGAIWVKFNDTDNDPVYIASGETLEMFNIETRNLYLTSAATTTAQVDEINYADETGVKAVTTFTPADFAGTTSGDYGVFYDSVGLAWAFSLDKTGSAPEPTGAIWTAIPSARKDNVDISTAVTAEDICGLVRTALNALTGFSAKFTTSGTVTLIITRDLVGPVTTADVSNADDSGNGSITFANTTTGVVSNHNNTYITLFARNSTTGVETVYGVWYNVNSEGTEPTDDTVDIWVPVAIAAADTDDTIAATAEAAIDALTGVFTSNDVTGTLSITHSVAGPRTNAVDNSSPDAVSTATDGDGSDTLVNIIVT